jgi:cytochrome P450
MCVIEFGGLSFLLPPAPNPAHFDNHQEFRPSRWDDLNENNSIFLGHGTRQCIGRRFAMTSAAVLLASILRDFKVDAPLRQGQTRDQVEEETMGHASLQGTAFASGPIALKFANLKR